MIVDVNMHHLPEDLFTNEDVLNGFLTTAPRGFGEIAHMGETPDATVVAAEDDTNVLAIDATDLSGYLEQNKSEINAAALDALMTAAALLMVSRYSFKIEFASLT